jgi:hypothetical protein
MSALFGVPILVSRPTAPRALNARYGRVIHLRAYAGVLAAQTAARYRPRSSERASTDVERSLTIANARTMRREREVARSAA